MTDGLPKYRPFPGVRAKWVWRASTRVIWGRKFSVRVYLEIFLAKFVLWRSFWITKNPIYRDEKMCFRSFGITQDCTRLWRILLYILLTLNSMLPTCHLTDSQYVVWFLRFFTFNQNVDIINTLTAGRADSPQSVTVRGQNDELPMVCIFENVLYRPFSWLQSNCMYLWNSHFKWKRQAFFWNTALDNLILK